jgi:hypothetical protein
MILGQAPLSRRRPPRHQPESCEHDPSKLSANLRELSLQAHRLVRAIDARGAQNSSGVDHDLSVDPRRELVEVHADIVQLQRNLRAQNLHNLASYVAALRQNVEQYLA